MEKNYYYNQRASLKYTDEYERFLRYLFDKEVVNVPELQTDLTLSYTYAKDLITFLCAYNVLKKKDALQYELQYNEEISDGLKKAENEQGSRRRRRFFDFDEKKEEGEGDPSSISYICNKTEALLTALFTERKAMIPVNVQEKIRAFLNAFSRALPALTNTENNVFAVKHAFRPLRNYFEYTVDIYFTRFFRTKSATEFLDMMKELLQALCFNKKKRMNFLQALFMAFGEFLTLVKGNKTLEKEPQIVEDLLSADRCSTKIVDYLNNEKDSFPITLSGNSATIDSILLSFYRFLKTYWAMDEDSEEEEEVEPDDIAEDAAHWYRYVKDKDKRNAKDDEDEDDEDEDEDDDEDDEDDEDDDAFDEDAYEDEEDEEGFTRHASATSFSKSVNKMSEIEKRFTELRKRMQANQKEDPEIVQRFTELHEGLLHTSALNLADETIIEECVKSILESRMKIAELQKFPAFESNIVFYLQSEKAMKELEIALSHAYDLLHKAQAVHLSRTFADKEYEPFFAELTAKREAIFDCDGNEEEKTSLQKDWDSYKNVKWYMIKCALFDKGQRDFTVYFSNTLPLEQGKKIYEIGAKVNEMPLENAEEELTDLVRSFVKEFDTVHPNALRVLCLVLLERLGLRFARPYDVTITTGIIAFLQNEWSDLTNEGLAAWIEKLKKE